MRETGVPLEPINLHPDYRAISLDYILAKEYRAHLRNPSQRPELLGPTFTNRGAVKMSKSKIVLKSGIAPKSILKKKAAPDKEPKAKSIASSLQSTTKAIAHSMVQCIIGWG